MAALNPAERQTLEERLRKMPLFQKTNDKAMAALLDGLEIRHAKAGTQLVKQGEFRSDFFIVDRGMATAYRTETDGSVEIIGTHGAGDWFGEMTALSHQAQFATVKIEAPSVLIVLNDTLFQKMYQWPGSFPKLVDERYKDRALVVHLRTAPLFKNAPRDVLQHIAQAAELKTFKEGRAIAKAGDLAEEVYLVRSGIVKRVVLDPKTGTEEVQAYLCDNSSFGERSLLDDARAWPVSYVAMSPVAVVCVSREIIERLLGQQSDTTTNLRQRARELVREETGAWSAEDMARQSASDVEMDVMVNRKAIVGGRALVIDLHSCTRCNACVESCVAVHEDGVPRLNKRGIRAGDHMLTSACYHCKIPECMLSCRFGAIRRDLQGAIEFITDNCVGCTACEEKCPYGVINMADLLPKDATPPNQSFLASLPGIGKLFRKNGEGDVERETKAIKCDLCAGMPFEACVYNCPCNAISRISPERLVAEGTFEES